MKKLIILAIVPLLFLSGCSMGNLFNKAEKPIVPNRAVPANLNQPEQVEPIVDNQFATSDAPVVENNDCIIGAVKFQKLAKWGDCQLDTATKLLFRTDYSKYQVDLVLELSKASKADYDLDKFTAVNIYKTKDNGEFYEYPQGGSLMGGMLKLDGNYYIYNFAIKSNQPTPSNLDGIWIPDSNVEKANFLEILKSAQINK